VQGSLLDLVKEKNAAPANTAALPDEDYRQWPGGSFIFKSWLNYYTLNNEGISETKAAFQGLRARGGFSVN
jgi:hypothetical protein